jgi:uncharacterized protein
VRLAAFLLASLALVAACAGASDRAGDPFPALEQSKVVAQTASGTHEFAVWIAADDRSRQRGLMDVRQLPPGQGMLFLFASPQEVAFWMKDTYLSLDLVFIAEDGTVVNVAPDARPLSLRPIESEGPVVAVLEIRAGSARRIGLKAGDRIVLPKTDTKVG